MGAKQKLVSATKSLVTKRRLVAIITLMVIMCALLAYFFISNSNTESEIELQSEATTTQSEIEQMLLNPVTADNTVDERLNYYDKLARLYEIQEKYRDAAQTMDRRISISDKGMTHAEYVSVATYYYQFKDIDNAQRYLDVAESKLIPVDRPGIGYSYQDWKDNIQKLREEYKGE